MLLVTCHLPACATSTPPIGLLLSACHLWLDSCLADSRDSPRLGWVTDSGTTWATWVCLVFCGVFKRLNHCCLKCTFLQWWWMASKRLPSFSVSRILQISTLPISGWRNFREPGRGCSQVAMRLFPCLLLPTTFYNFSWLLSFDVTLPSLWRHMQSAGAP